MTQEEFDALFGVDISIGATLDVTPEFTEVTGIPGFIEACVRRLSTPRGDLFYDDTYGFDLTQFCSDSFSIADIPTIQTGVVEQLQLDERCERATCTVDNVTLEGFHVNVSVFTAEGPFQFTLAVDKVSVTMLNSQASNG